DAHAVGDPRAVVGHGDVRRSIGGYGCFRFDPDGIVEPSFDEVDLNLAPVEDDAIAVPLRLVAHPRENRPPPRTARLRPGREGEPVIKAEPRDIAGVDRLSASAAMTA